MLPLLQENMHLADKNGIANLLRLSKLSKPYQIYFDTSIESAFYVFKDDGAYIKFELRDNGPYSLDVNDGSNPINLLEVKDPMEQLSELDIKEGNDANIHPGLPLFPI